MKLRDWMKLNGMSDEAVAIAIGRDRSFVTKLKNEVLRPSIETTASIQRLTDGAVTATDYEVVRPALAEGAPAVSAPEQARVVADTCATFHVHLDDGKIARMADVLSRRRETWVTDAKQAANLRFKLRARRLRRLRRLAKGRA